MATSVHAGPAISAGVAWLPVMNPADAWQVLWPHVTVSVYGVPQTCYAGELLPATPYAEEMQVRQVLAQAGALRRVTAAADTTKLRALVAAAAAAELTRRAADAAERGAALPGTANPVPFLDIGPLRFAGPAT